MMLGKSRASAGLVPGRNQMEEDGGPLGEWLAWNGGEEAPRGCGSGGEPEPVLERGSSLFQRPSPPPFPVLLSSSSLALS